MYLFRKNFGYIPQKYSKLTYHVIVVKKEAISFQFTCIGIGSVFRQAIRKIDQGTRCPLLPQNSNFRQVDLDASSSSVDIAIKYMA